MCALPRVQLAGQTAMVGGVYYEHHAPPRGGVLSVIRVCNMGSLAQLLESVLLPGMPVNRLELGGKLSAAALLGCPLLAALPELDLGVQAAAGGSGLNDVLLCLLQQASRLTALRLSMPTDTAWLESLSSRQGLTKLDLTSCQLTDLPPGPYLESE